MTKISLFDLWLTGLSDYGDQASRIQKAQELLKLKRVCGWGLPVDRSPLFHRSPALRARSRDMDLPDFPFGIVLTDVWEDMSNNWVCEYYVADPVVELTVS